MSATVKTQQNSLIRNLPSLFSSAPVSKRHHKPPRQRQTPTAEEIPPRPLIIHLGSPATVLPRINAGKYDERKHVFVAFVPEGRPAGGGAFIN